MPPPDDMRRRPLPVLMGIAAAIVAIWCAVTVFQASDRFYSGRAFGDDPLWSEVLLGQLNAALVWAVFTPIVVAVAERLSFRRERLLRSLLALLAVIPLLAAVRTVGGAIVVDSVAGYPVTPETIRWILAVMIHYNILIVAVIVGITKMIDVYRDADADERRALELQAAVVDAKAEQLRAQTQPSLLFGVLRAIRERVRSDPAAADRMLVILGELLRRRLHQPSSGMVSLEEELEVVERYFDLQRERFRSPIEVHLDVDDDILDAAVPPFALQTLLETTVGDQRPEWVYVRGEARGDVLALEVRTEVRTNMALVDLR